ncbi:hypothetical protein NC652_033175 [Populus alba x Populus x berolinensis]|nr:hypothetical protein NC652_033175 [Populus alba x Populus x berolinensis]
MKQLRSNDLNQFIEIESAGASSNLDLTMRVPILEGHIWILGCNQAPLSKDLVVEVDMLRAIYVIHIGAIPYGQVARSKTGHQGVLRSRELINRPPYKAYGCIRKAKRSRQVVVGNEAMPVFLSSEYRSGAAAEATVVNPGYVKDVGE